MNAPTCCLARIPANGKFWLRNARVADGLRDIRIEDGRVRALLAAGESPCCAPGLDLDGGAVRPMAGDGPVAAGDPADLWVTLCGGRTVPMRAGRLDENRSQNAGPLDGSDR
ncbi:hypothetical protein VY88_23030 [Azospirillum thiophilum]|uniref:Uncharacterized protein n=1 Tax=Azospirillum thiophilum TaxID=528244 RepID=A0AAC8W253_9PROT|nr:hypothetical protein [Azospirillum thiophilum]ALG73677.1 hypothetical protein AL072_22200 [Azospirillum thiophilum]KJR63375.1 hypothetical protein VY88_23030 [Azospirillum thiophilum]